MSKEKAEYAELESECQDLKKFVPYNGFFWKLFDWVERKAAKWRQEL